MTDTSKRWLWPIGAWLVVAAGGCQRDGVVLMWPTLGALKQVPATAVLGPIRLERGDFTRESETDDPRRLDKAQDVRWLRGDRFRQLTQDSLVQSRLFQEVELDRPRDKSEYLVLRPSVTVNQHLRLSMGGTMLTVGTGLIYTILGGSAVYRYATCEVAVDVESADGRPIATYLSRPYRSREELVTEAPEQFGPLVSYAFTKALEDVSDQISADNNLLAQALGAKVVHLETGPMRVIVRSPRQTIVRSRQVRVSGHVRDVDRPAELAWTVNGAPGGPAPLTSTPAESVKQFAFETALPTGRSEVVLTVRGKGPGAPTLGETRLRYVCVPHAEELPEIRQCWAVIIGISNYAHGGKGFPDLKYADRDARAFRDFLLSPRGGKFSKDRVFCRINKQASFAEVRHGMFEFLARAGKDDLVVVFFSGHGMPQPGTENFFMLCHDTHPDRLASTAFPMWDIDTALRRFVRAERVVVLADACHSGGLSVPPGAKGGGGNPTHRYLQKLALAEPGRLFFTAGEAQELSFESPKLGGGHGVFTHYLLEGLNGRADADSDGVVTAGEVIEYVRRNVAKATHEKQHPNPSGNYDRTLPLSVPGVKK